jgi:hypothetical protein
MLELEDVVANRLEAEGCLLAEVVVEHVLLCLRSQDPQVSSRWCRDLLSKFWRLHKSASEKLRRS